MLRHKLDKIRRYRTALIIEGIMWGLQLFTYLALAQSLTLLGDTGHSFADVLLLLGTFVIFRNEFYHPEKDYGPKKVILVRIAVILLWINAVYIFWEASVRIAHPVNFSGWPVLVAAIISALGNFIAHRVIHGVDQSEQDHAHDANVAHILTDLALALAVLFSALGNIIFKLPAIDAWLSLIVAAWMLRWGWKLLQRTRTSSIHVHHDDDHDHRH